MVNKVNHLWLFVLFTVTIFELTMALGIPSVQVLHSNYSVIFGQDITLECVVTSNHTYNHTSVQWQKLVNNQFQSITFANNKYGGSTVNTPSLTVNSADLNDEAFYICTATNSLGTGQSSQTFLYVIGNLLTVTIQQPQYSVLIGSSVTLGCTVTGSPSVTSVYWQKSVNNVVTTISTANTNKYSGSTVNTTSLTITGTDLNDKANYVCFATNAVGTAQSSQSFLDVTGNIPSVQVLQPQYSVNFGSSVTLERTVTANPTHTSVAWQRIVNGQVTSINFAANKYSGSTVNTPSLTINNADHTDEGNYVCTATNSIGTGQSTQTFLDVVGNLLTVTIQQPQYSVLIGSSVTLGCTVTGSPSVTSVYWQKSVNNVVTTISTANTNKYSGSTVNTPSLTITGADLNDEANYVCFATNAVGTAQSSQSFLDVTGNIPSVQVLQPQYSVNFSSSVTLECTVTANPTHTSVTWEHIVNGQIYEITSFKFAANKYSGSTVNTPSLTINNADLNDEGNYVCTATNSIGTGESTQTFLGVVGNLLTVTIQQPQYSVLIGSSVTLGCTVTGSPSVTSVYWQKSVNNVVTTISTANTNKYSGSTVNTPSLTITGADLNDEANYVCFATNAVGTAQSSQSFLDVTGNIPSVQVSQPQYSMNFGSSVTLECTVTANPTHTSVTWQRIVNGLVTSINFAANKYSGSTVNTPSLTINNADRNDEGNYICTATNSIGTGQSTQTFLDVVGNVLIVQTVQSSYSVLLGNSRTLECLVSGSPAATQVYWQKIQNGVTTTINRITNTNKYTGSTVNTPSLTISNAEQNDEANYICFATNAFGTGQSQQTFLDVTGTCRGGFHYFEEADSTVYFQSVTANFTAISSEMCITDKRPLATADCINQQGQTAELKHFALNPKCIFNDLHKSTVTDTLFNLTMVTIGEDNRQIVIDTLKPITSNTDILTSIDIIYIAKILVNIANVARIDEYSATDIVNIVNAVIKIDVEILERSQKRGSATSRILEVLESIQQNVDLQNKTSIRIVRPNIFVDIYDVSEMNSPVIGIQIEDENEQSLTTSMIDPLFSDSNITTQAVDAALILPVEIIQENNTRVSLNIYRNSKLFSVSSKKNPFLPNSRVIAASVTVDGVDIKSLGEYHVQTIFLPRIDSENNYCGYWDFDLYDNSGGWSTDGCNLNRTASGRLFCVCNHLTNFAVLINIGGQDTLEEGIAIQIITWIGLILSITGLSLTVLSSILFKHLRQGRPQQTLLGLALSLLCFLVVFVVGIKLTQNFYGCIVVAALLHYFILVSFMWMLIEGILQYLSFVKVLGTYIPNFILKAGMTALGLPLIPVIAVLATDYEMYQGGTKACWMSMAVFYYAFVIPVGIIMIANIVIFILVLKSLVSRSKGLTSNQSKAKKAITNIRAALSVSVLLGLTWLFGFFTIEKASVIFQYIFTILNVFQGFVIFLLFTARQQKVGDEWKKLCCKGKQKDKYKQRNTSSDQKCTNSNVASGTQDQEAKL